MNTGILYAALAYIAWGLFPLYFKQVADVPSLEVVMHRTLWSLVFVFGVLMVRRQWSWMGTVLRQPKVLAAFVLSAMLLSGNWLTYVWAVQNQHVVDASLGYFILPLVNVALGFVFLRERPRSGQWMAVAVAAAGVLWLAMQAGRLPWIALVLALSFGFYGLLRKVAMLGALEAGLVGVARPGCAGAGHARHRRLAAACGPHDGSSAAAVCGGCAPDPHVHLGHPAVHLAQPAVCAGRVVVP